MDAVGGGPVGNGNVVPRPRRVRDLAAQSTAARSAAAQSAGAQPETAQASAAQASVAPPTVAPPTVPLSVPSASGPPAGGSSPEFGHRRRTLLPWCPPAALAAALGLWGVGTPGAWSDEMATWGVVSTPWGEMIATFRDRDAFIAPYYLLLHCWGSVFGTSDTALRLPSVFAIAVACGLLAVLGERLVSRPAGLLAGLLLAITPMMSRYAQEERVYTLAVAAAVLATLLLDRALERPSWRRFGGYTAAMTLLGWFHAFALALLAAHLCAVLLRPGRTRRMVRDWAASSAVAVVLVSPLLVAAYVQRGYGAWIPPVTWDTLLDLFTLAGETTPAVGALTVGAALAARVDRRAGAMLVSWAVLPLAVLLGASLVEPMYVDRYVLYVVPAWMLLAAAGMERAAAGLRHATNRAIGGLGAGAVLRIAVAIVIFAGVGLPGQRLIRGSAGHGQDSRAAAAVITDQFLSGDAIVYALPDAGGSWFARDIVARYVPADRRPRDALVVRPQRVGGRVAADECVNPAPCLGDASRVWVLRNGAVGDPLAGMPAGKKGLFDDYVLVRVWSLSGITVALYERNPRGRAV